MILYYSCSNKPAPFLERTFARLLTQAAAAGQSLVAVTGRELAGAPAQLLLHKRPNLPMWQDLFERIIAGIELARPAPQEIVYLAEDDILYPDEHFHGSCIPGHLMHNFNVLYTCERGYFTRYANYLLLSQYWGPAQLLHKAASMKRSEAKANACGCVEPCGPGYPSVLRFDHPTPSIDIRHSRAFNHSWTAADATKDPEVIFFDEHPAWGLHRDLWAKWNPERPVDGGRSDGETVGR